ncbi:MAG: sugar O-acetyltransferase [Pygmaiobacter massiliensis]|nr:sugar O-acetyltransferase [Pygmaiobacter massiliensis]
MTEQEKMARGDWYDANHDPCLLEMRAKAEQLCFELNQLPPMAKDRRAALLRRLLPYAAEDVEILSPFYTDYGTNCHIGGKTFINHNAYFMDGALITIGERCFIGPNCGIYTALHPMHWEDRAKGLERAVPVIIQDDVWLGADVKVLPGVTIGRGCVVGAGSVVTRDLPAGWLAVGNPCRPLRPITQADFIEQDKEAE